MICLWYWYNTFQEDSTEKSGPKIRVDKSDNISPVWCPNPTWVGALESPQIVGESMTPMWKKVVTWIIICGEKWSERDYLTHDKPLWVNYKPWRAPNDLKAWRATCPSLCYISKGSRWVSYLFMHSRLNTLGLCLSYITICKYAPILSKSLPLPPCIIVIFHYSLGQSMAQF